MAAPMILFEISFVWTLECLALSQAFGSITEKHIHNLAEANERFLEKMKAEDRLSALEADYAFHSIYVKLLNNQELKKSYPN